MTRYVTAEHRDAKTAAALVTTTAPSRIASWLAAAALTLPGSAAAQDEPVATLEQIVVTATRREQSIQDVAAAVSAMSGDALVAAGVDTVGELSRQIPALEVVSNTSLAQSNFRLRRVGNLGNISTFEPAVGVFVDGAFRLSPVFAVGELFDIDRVEVLRGPQNALHGKSTTAGLVAIYTKPPERKRAGEAEIGIGNVQGARDALSTRFKGRFTGPLTDTLSASLGVAALDEEATWTSAVANGGEDANDADRLGVRGQLLWNVSDTLDLRLILATMREDDKQISEDVTFDPDGFVSGIVLPVLRAAGISDTCTDNDAHNRRHCLRTAVHSDVDVREATLLTDWDLANGRTLGAVTSWDEYELFLTANDVAQVAAPVLRYRNMLATRSFQQDVRITSAAGTSFDWLAGFFYFQSEHERGDGGERPMWLYDELSDDPAVGALHQALFNFQTPLPFATQGQVGMLDGAQDTDYVSVYGHTTWRPSRRFALNTGLRWQDEQKDAHVIQGTNDPSPSVISLLLAPAAVSASGLHRDTREATWSVTPQWFVSDTTMLFTTLAHGFKSGGFNIGFGRLPVAEREFQDEDVEHFEIGIKSELADGRIHLAASAFQTDYNDYQDAAFVGTQFTVGNAEEVTLDGVEVEGTATLTRALTLHFDISYADLVYATNTHGACRPGFAPNSRTSQGACDLSGEHPINAPRLKTHLGLSYERPTSWGDLFARGDWSTTSEYNTTFSADPRLFQPSYDWINVRVGTRWDRYEIVAWAENLTDETVASVEGVLNIYAGDQSYQSYLQAPRSLGVTFRASFP